MNIREALKQVEVHCDNLMPSYEMVSLRGALYTLGFDESEANEVIDAAYVGGFKYCIDPRYRNADNEYIPMSVCYYGPDQLKSRIQCIHIRD